MWPKHIPVLAAGNLQHVDHFTSFGKYSSTSLPFLIQLLPLNFHDVPSAMSNISTTIYEVCAEIYAVGYMTDCCMTVVVQIDSPQALTALLITLMTLLIKILFIYFVTNMHFVLSLTCYLQLEIEHVGSLNGWFGL
jgi:hypothetical protein